MTLEPGDIVATGTRWARPWAARRPAYLRPGDVVRADIEGLGGPGETDHARVEVVTRSVVTGLPDLELRAGT